MSIVKTYTKLEVYKRWDISLARAESGPNLDRIDYLDIIRQVNLTKITKIMLIS